jgi:DNA polymerase
MNLNELQKTASVCTDCSLHHGRVVPVFAKGNPKADIIICGMCPGPDENKKDNLEKAPFIGPAGKLLDEMLIDVGLSLDDVYITNLVKCYVKPGISLDIDWISHCVSYFIGQLSFVKPKVIVSLGADVGKFLLNEPKSSSLSKLRSIESKYLNIPVVATYHPSYFTRAGNKKHKNYSKGLDDFNKAIKMVYG